MSHISPYSPPTTALPPAHPTECGQYPDVSELLLIFQSITIWSIWLIALIVHRVNDYDFNFSFFLQFVGNPMVLCHLTFKTVIQGHQPRHFNQALSLMYFKLNGISRLQFICRKIRSFSVFYVSCRDTVSWSNRI